MTKLTTLLLALCFALLLLLPTSADARPHLLRRAAYRASHPLAPVGSYSGPGSNNGNGCSTGNGYNNGNSACNSGTCR